MHHNDAVEGGGRERMLNEGKRPPRYGEPGFNWRKQVVTRFNEKHLANYLEYLKVLDKNPSLASGYDPAWDMEGAQATDFTDRIIDEKEAEEKKRSSAKEEERQRREEFTYRAAQQEETRMILRDERSERRRLHWVHENRRAAERAELFDASFCLWLQKTDKRLLREIQAVNEASKDRKKLREEDDLVIIRRSESVVYDDHGKPWRLNMDGTYKKYVDKDSSSAEHDQLGLLILRDPQFRASYQAFLEERYEMGLDKVERLGRMALRQESVRQDGDPFKKKGKGAPLNEVVAATGRLKEKAMDTFTGPESADHLGQEACARERFMWLQNRLLCMFKAVGLLQYTEIRPGCLASLDHGRDLAFIEKKEGHRKSSAEVAHAFAKGPRPASPLLE